MKDWRDPAKYEFPDAQDLRRWAWEFMRRNPDYRHDHESARHGQTAIFVETSGFGLPAGTGLNFKQCVASFYGARWGQAPTIQDPACDAVPDFRVFPLELGAESVGAFFQVSRPSGGLIQHPHFLTIAIDLRGPASTQLAEIRELIKRRQKGIPVRKPTQPAIKEWKLYLRVLDAMDVGAKSKEIIAVLDYEKNYASTGAQADATSKRLSAHRKQARRLRDDPLAILR